MRLTLLASPAFRIQKTAMTLASRGTSLKRLGVPADNRSLSRRLITASFRHKVLKALRGQTQPIIAVAGIRCCYSRCCYSRCCSESLSLRILLSNMDGGVADDIGVKETRCFDWGRHGLAKLKPCPAPPVELLCSGVWHLCLRWVRREELAARGRVTGVARCDEGDWKA